MHLDIALGQPGPFRPTRRFGGQGTPLAGLYTSGAGTPPARGTVGTPAKLAAKALLADCN